MSSVLRISEASSIALHAMIMLAKNNNRLVSVKDIAAEYNISANHLSKVLQRLVKTNLVVSVKGAKGGFRLAKNPEDISFLEIYEAIDGKINMSECLLGSVGCKNSICIMGNLIVSVNNQVKLYFEKKKLSDFLYSSI